MIFPSLETSISTNGIHMDSDKNDLYALRKCIVWLQRHILRYPCFDTETMKLACWILGEDMQELGNYLLSQVSGNKKERFKEELSESALNPNDYAPDIAKMLRESPSINKLKFTRFAAGLMNKKLACLKYHGKSEIEKNIMALTKLFDLSDNETELCTFFFISNAYSYAEDYFLNHMECHKFAGQKYLAYMLGISKKELHSIVYGKLKRVGLYDVDRYGISAENDFIDLVQNPSDENLSNKFFINVPKGTVPLKDYLIGKDLTDQMMELLKNKSESPTHILFYGPPGTGKTSFAYMI